MISGLCCPATFFLVLFFFCSAAAFSWRFRAHLFRAHLWPSIVGTRVALASLTYARVRMRAASCLFRRLNYFMRERGLRSPMRITLREYFQSARRVHQVTTPPRKGAHHPHT